ncbi:MAG: hypothetical protein AAF806_20935 [Bacteroidota bacterium]
MTKLITALSLMMTFNLAFGQAIEEEEVAKRIFMPSIQLGYLNNLSDELSGGLFIQTSIEYQTPKGLFFRVNYDDYDSDFELEDTQSSIDFQRGKVSFSELIGGIGYRETLNQHNFLVAAQMGYRFYGFPLVEEQGNDIILKFDNRTILSNRYTLGYEYEIDDKAFLALELFASHALKGKDYWADQAWAVGFTIGITTTIF